MSTPDSQNNSRFTILLSFQVDTPTRKARINQ
jgi:hypothetical protein